MRTRRSTEVLVVGAGPVGLFTALMLAKRDIGVRIIDRHKRTNVHSYALALHPASLRLLDDIGLASDAAGPGRWVERAVYHEGADERASIRLDSISGSFPYAAVLPQAQLEGVLERALEEAGVRVEWNHELVGLEEHGGEMLATIRRYDLQPQGYPIMQLQRVDVGEHQQPARFVIGADGYHSFVRSAMGFTIEEFGDPTTLCVFEFESAPSNTSEVRIGLDPAGASVLWPLSGGLRRWSFQVPHPPSSREEPKDLLAKLIAERAPWYGEEVRDLRWSTTVRFEKRAASSFGSAMVWLAGDAAHVGNPVGVHSLNFGMREGWELAWRIYEILRDQGTTRLLEENAAARRIEWLRLAGAQDLPEPGEGATPWVAGNAARILATLPATGKDMKELLAQVGVAWNP